jgi:GTP-binding protein
MVLGHMAAHRAGAVRSDRKSAAPSTGPCLALATLDATSPPLHRVPAGIADTIASPAVEAPLDPGHIDPPTLSMVFGPNDSPLAGRAGKAVTGRAIGARLSAEAETSVSLRVKQAGGWQQGVVPRGWGASGSDTWRAALLARPGWAAAQARAGLPAGADRAPAPLPPPAGGGGERYEVQARGELQLGVLIENMRREGLELAVSPPMVLYRWGCWAAGLGCRAGGLEAVRGCARTAGA